MWYGSPCINPTKVFHHQRFLCQKMFFSSECPFPVLPESFENIPFFHRKLVGTFSTQKLFFGKISTGKLVSWTLYRWKQLKYPEFPSGNGNSVVNTAKFRCQPCRISTFGIDSIIGTLPPYFGINVWKNINKSCLLTCLNLWRLETC